MLSMRASASVRHHHRHHRQRSLSCLCSLRSGCFSFVCNKIICQYISTSAPRSKPTHRCKPTRAAQVRGVVWGVPSPVAFLSNPVCCSSSSHGVACISVICPSRCPLFIHLLVVLLSLSLSLPRRSGCLPFSLSDSLFPSPTFNHLLKAILLPFLPAPLLLTGS